MHKNLEKILATIDTPLEDPRFPERAFTELSSSIQEALKNEADAIKQIILNDYEELSRMLDKSWVQDSCSVRNILKTRALAKILINEDGDLDTNNLSRAISLLHTHLYSLGPDRQFDSKRNEHILKVLTTLKDNKQLVRLLKLISKPYMHKHAEQLIRDTLRLSSKTQVTDVHARRAVLSAWLCYLRQNVGSCFATAPAIIIHDEQPETFLKDIQELLSTGRLKRTFGGVEYVVPLSYSWGAGDLRKILQLSKNYSPEDFTLWQSSGILKAFEAGGIIAQDLTEKQKIELCKEIIMQTISQWNTTSVWFFVTVEDLIRQVMLRYFSLSEEDIREYELRPQGIIHGGLFMATTALSAKEKKSAEFLQKFESSLTAFKSLADNALLKAWEFTLASFSETKAEFTRWNLYSSLGLGPQESGGIGQCLYEILKRKVEVCNQAVEEHQILYEQTYVQLQYVQSKLQNVSSEKELQWLRIEYQTKSNEFRVQEEIRNEFHTKAKRYANLFDGLIDLYDQLFPKYFQEVYDADIHEVTTGPYDDSPAGFRLLYKHGRSNTSSWTLIKNSTEFIDALATFFTTTETELAGSRELNGLQDDLSEIVSAIVSHVRSKAFLESAFYRMAVAHQAPIIEDPLNHLDKIEKKPWVYTSGGAMSTLVSCYFRLSSKPTEIARWVENPMELLVFLVDNIKGLPEKVQDELEKNAEKSLLIHSPTHAFLLKPGYPIFKEAWKSKEFTYTWVRDNIVKPMEDFSDHIFLNEDYMQYIIENLLTFVPNNSKHYFKQVFSNIGGSMNVRDFRQFIVDTIELTQGLHYGGRGVISSEQIDTLLFSILPLFPSYLLQERVEKIVDNLGEITPQIKQEISRLIEDLSRKIGAPKIISAKSLQEIVKSLLSMAIYQTSTEYNWPLAISHIAQKEGYALPTSFLFADTNWVKDNFAFIVNPGTRQFELWRVDYTGTLGAPMGEWKQWLDGSRQNPTWGVYLRPHEYSY
jgi:hypothetical protein